MKGKVIMNRLFGEFANACWRVGFTIITIEILKKGFVKTVNAVESIINRPISK